MVYWVRYVEKNGCSNQSEPSAQTPLHQPLSLKVKVSLWLCQ